MDIAGSGGFDFVRDFQDGAVISYNFHDDFRTHESALLVPLGISLRSNSGYDLGMTTGAPGPTAPPIELRAAVRFPLRIPIAISTEVGEVNAMTVNISANGVLFELASALDVGGLVSFTIPMPAEAMGTPADVVVRCAGRVVRCAENGNGWHAAAVIDKYYFSH